MEARIPYISERVLPSSGTSGQQINVGDVVLVHDDYLQIIWKMAVVESLVKGSDGLVRSVNIRTKEWANQSTSE